jgi:hypothetical protein
LPDLSCYNIPKPGKNIPNNNQIYQMTIKYIYQMATKYAKWPQNIPNDHKIHQMTTKYTKWLQNIPNGPKINLHLPLQVPPKFTQIIIFVLKICHLATLL